MSAILRKETPTSVLEPIPADAFNVIRDAVQSLGGSFTVLDEDGPAAYSFGFVPIPHYCLDVTADAEVIDDITVRIDPLIHELVTRYTRQVAVSD